MSGGELGGLPGTNKERSRARFTCFNSKTYSSLSQSEDHRPKVKVT